jgi:hypothetical protein
MNSLEEHEIRLKQLNERFLAGNLSREQANAEMSRLLGEDNLAYRLREALMREVNSRLSWKGKERLSTRQYFMKRSEIEEDVIGSDFCYAFFENESTLTEIGELEPSLIDAKTLMLCVISALRTYIDNEQENSPKAVLLHKLYLQLKQQLSAEIPFEAGDGFADYVASKTERQEFEEARETGKICIRCGSNNVHSKGAEWCCFDCGKRFRKR